MATKVVLITAIIAVCSSYANGICPARESDTTVVLRYLRISSDGLTDEIIKSAIQNFLARNNEFALTSKNAAISCRKIAELRPSYGSGYYWIQGVSGAVEVYCEMGTNNGFGQSGGWMRIANVDMRKNHSQCPPGQLVYNVTEGRRLCRKPRIALGCSSTTFNTQGVEYTQVCGKVVRYQYFQTNGFGPSWYATPLINQTYVDGVSITHGSPRQHVWSFAAAHDEVITTDNPAEYTSCPCLHSTFQGVIPDYVGNDYHCETGSRNEAERHYYFEDPLWDGEGCEGENECCDRGGPWFCKQLPQLTRDDIEMRVCTNSVYPNEDVVLEQIELYVQ